MDGSAKCFDYAFVRLPNDWAPWVPERDEQLADKGVHIDGLSGWRNVECPFEAVQSIFQFCSGHQ
jgi:hypothetical protein